MTKELKQQLTLKISQANKTQLIIILYEMVLLYTEESRQAWHAGDRSAFREAIRKTRGCMNELMSSLHFEYEPAWNLLQLYLYINRELARADVHHETESLDHIDLIIKKLHDAYQSISKQDASEPLMANAQAVYAGLTYGKRALTESLTNQGIDRGFRA